MSKLKQAGCRRSGPCAKQIPAIHTVLLKQQAEAKLNISRIRSGNDPPEILVGDVGRLIASLKERAVRQIENFGTELNVVAFFHNRILEDGYVDALAAGPAKIGLRQRVSGNRKRF